MKPAKLEREWKAKVGNKSVANVWGRIEEIERETLTVRPPNSVNANEYAIKRNITRGKAREILERWSKLGKATRHKCAGSSLVYYTFNGD